MAVKKKTASKKKVVKVEKAVPLPSELIGDVEVRVRTFRGVPLIPGKVFMSTGTVKHPATLIVPAAEAERRSDLVEVVGQVVDDPSAETESVSDEEFIE